VHADPVLSAVPSTTRVVPTALIAHPASTALEGKRLAWWGNLLIVREASAVLLILLPSRLSDLGRAGGAGVLVEWGSWVAFASQTEKLGSRSG
jgi:hypothetical protein